ncbi:MAG: 2-amino-4-hydroxy-6-hydroxymethyldihydropteridine diphosphokinase [Pseudomonadota bacterium]
MLAALQAMEAAFGRVRSDDPSARYAPRTLDLDILSYGSEVVESAALTLPHPRMAERDFVLMPLHDLMPDWQHPVLGQTAQELLAGLPSTSASRRC